MSGIMFSKAGRPQQNTNKKKKQELVAFDYNINLLNKYIGYVFKKDKNINRKTITILEKLLSLSDTRPYEADDKIMARFEFLSSAVYGRLHEGIEDTDLLLDYAKVDSPNEHVSEIIANLPLYRKLSYDDINYVNNSVSDKVQFVFIHLYKEMFLTVFEDIESGTFRSYEDIVERTKFICQSLLTEIRRSESINTEESFSLEDVDMIEKVRTVVENLKNPRRLLKTGLQSLNDSLVGGYQSTRLYIYLGLPAGFKSGMLIKSCVDIKKYNSDVPAEVPGKRRTVLLVTMENTVEESIERIFNMYIDPTPITEFETDEVVRLVKETGIFQLNGPDDIDFVIIYKPNKSINTGDLISIMEDLEDSNREIIALVVDYIKRIRPTMPGKDEKEELKNVTDELKSIAIYKDIPVISAHQMNRDAASKVDSAVVSNKDDIAKLLGRSNVGSAWEVLENADWVGIVNVELKTGTKTEYYLTVNRVKIRYRDPHNLHYFNQPFGNDSRIMLMDDIYLDERLSIESIGSDFEGILNSIDSAGSKGKLNAVERLVAETSSKDIFNFNKALSVD